MIEGLRARFLGRFVESARRRLDHARSLEEGAGEGALGGIAHELHGLAGEASMLELSELGGMARACERAAREGDREAVRRGLEGLRAATETLAAQAPVIPDVDFLE